MPVTTTAQSQGGSRLDKLLRQQTSDVTGSSINQFLTDAEYDQAVKVSGWQQKYSNMTKNQMQAAIAGLEDGEEKTWLSEYEKFALRNVEDYDYELARTKWELDRMEKALPEFQRLAKAYADLEGWEEDEEISALYGKELSALKGYRNSYGDPNRLTTLIQQKKDEINELKNGRKYNLLDNEADFAELSQYSGDGDWLQEYVNDPESADSWDTAFHVAKHTPTPVLGTLARLQEKFGYQNIHLMEDPERARFNYLYNKNGENAAKEYLDALQKTLNERSTKKLNSWVADRTKDIPVFSQVYTSLLSTPIKLLSGEGMLDNEGIINQQTANPRRSAAEQMLEGRYPDTARSESSAQMHSTLTNQSDKINQKPTAKNVGQLNATVPAANSQANQADVAWQLISKGISSKKADSIAEAIVAGLNDQEPTRSQRNLRSNA